MDGSVSKDAGQRTDLSGGSAQNLPCKNCSLSLEINLFELLFSNSLI